MGLTGMRTAVGVQCWWVDAGAHTRRVRSRRQQADQAVGTRFVFCFACREQGKVPVAGYTGAEETHRHDGATWTGSESISAPVDASG